MQIHDKGETTPEGQVPEPDRHLVEAVEAVQATHPGIIESLLKKGPPKIRLTLGDYKARVMLGSMKRQPPPWLTYALSGLPMPMFWWEHPFGRPKDAE